MSGAENIIEMINAKASEEESKILTEAEDDAKLRLDVATKRAEEKANEILAKAKSELNAELDRYEASAKLKVKQKILQAKETIIQNVLIMSQEELRKRVTSKKYEADLLRLIADGADPLEGDEFELVYPRDQKITIEAAAAKKEIDSKTGKKSKVSISEDTIRSEGGVIVRIKSGEKWVDNTIEARMQRLESEIRNAITEILFPEDY